MNNIQKEFLLATFFKANFPKWRVIAENLIDNGVCIVAGEHCPWKVGIGNFIGCKETPVAVGCIELTFDVKDFCSQDNQYWMSQYQPKLRSLKAEIQRLQIKYDELVKIAAYGY